MRLKAFLCLLLSLLLSFLLDIPCVAKEYNQITLQMKPMSVTDERFYIKEIIDGRIDKSNIGLKKGWFNDEPVTLEGDFSKIMLSYLNLTYSVSDNKVPVILKINVLEIEETRRLTDLYTSVKAKVGFYIEKDGKLGKVYEAEAVIEQKSLSEADEQLIRKVLESCLRSFVMSDWEKEKPTWEDYQQVRALSSPNDFLITIMPEWHHGVFLEISNGKAFNLSDNEPDDSIYKCGIYEYTEKNPAKIVLTKSYMEYQSFQANNTINLFGGHDEETLYRLGNSNFVCFFSGDIPVGVRLIDNKFDNLLVGIKFEQGIGWLLGDGDMSGGQIYLKLYESHWWGTEPDGAGVKFGFSVPID